MEVSDKIQQTIIYIMFTITKYYLVSDYEVIATSSIKYDFYREIP